MYVYSLKYGTDTGTSYTFLFTFVCLILLQTVYLFANDEKSKKCLFEPQNWQLIFDTKIANYYIKN